MKKTVDILHLHFGHAMFQYRFYYAKYKYENDLTVRHKYWQLYDEWRMEAIRLVHNLCNRNVTV